MNGPIHAMMQAPTLLPLALTDQLDGHLLFLSDSIVTVQMVWFACLAVYHYRQVAFLRHGCFTITLPHTIPSSHGQKCITAIGNNKHFG